MKMGLSTGTNGLSLIAGNKLYFCNNIIAWGKSRTLESSGGAGSRTVIKY